MKKWLALALLLGTMFFAGSIQAQEPKGRVQFLYQITELEVKAAALDYLVSKDAPTLTPKEMIPFLTKLVAMEKADQARLKRKILCIQVKNSHPACTLPENSFFKGPLVRDPVTNKLFHKGHDKKPVPFFIATIVRERLIILNIQQGMKGQSRNPL